MLKLMVQTFLISQLIVIQNIWKHLKKFQWSRRSLYICMLTRLIYSKEKYKMIPIDLSKQQTQDADPKSIKQTNVTENTERTGTIERFFILKKEKKT